MLCIPLYFVCIDNTCTKKKNQKRLKSMDKQRRNQFFCENPKFYLFWQNSDFRPKSQPILLKLVQGIACGTNQRSAQH